MHRRFALAAVAAFICGCERQAAPSAASARPGSCLATIGFEGSGHLVSDCGELAGVSHPACDARNSCEIIHAEIKRRCAALAQGQKPEACETWD